MSVTITLPGNAPSAFQGARYDPAVKAGLLGFYIFGGALGFSLMNHAPSGIDASLVGSVGPSDFGASWMNLKQGRRWLETYIPDQPTELFLIVRSQDAMVSNETRPVFAGTSTTGTTTSGLAGGGKGVFVATAAPRLGIGSTNNNGGANPGYTATIGVPTPDWAGWRLINARFEAGQIYAEDMTTGISATQAVSYPYAPNTRSWRVGGWQASAERGTADYMAAAIYEAGMSEQSRAAVINQLRRLAAFRGGVAV